MILDDIVASKHRQLREEESDIPLSVLERSALLAPPPLDFEASMRKSGLSIIAEVKKASPSKGLISADFHPAETAITYVAGGADCISVLTERHFFQGSDENLTEVRNAVKCPILRKDFILCERQVVGTRALGADCILLIAAILNDAALRRLFRLSSELGMGTLMEAHTEDEAKRLVQAGGRLIGINSRNLSDFTVDLGTFGRIRQVIPPSCATVAESGIGTADDVRRLADDGCDAVLIGEMLMRSGNPAGALSLLKKAWHSKTMTA